jgi:hypothetical protein
MPPYFFDVNKKSKGEDLGERGGRGDIRKYV